MGRATNIDMLEGKIEKAQDDVVRAKKRYDAATATLKELLDKRECVRNQELIRALAQSSRSYDEILNYLKGTK